MLSENPSLRQAQLRLGSLGLVAKPSAAPREAPQPLWAWTASRTAPPSVEAANDSRVQRVPVVVDHLFE